MICRRGVVRVSGNVCPSRSGCLRPTSMMCISPGVNVTVVLGAISTAGSRRIRDTPFSSLSL